MKRYILILIPLAVLFTGCLRPYNKPDLVEIQPNETAFVIPLTGASEAGQAQFDSIGFLESKKVATKRIEIPMVWFKTNRAWGAMGGKYIPTAKVITVSRTPVTRMWEPKEDAAGKVNGGIEVESKDSIGFALGINITAQVTEPDTATFLYYYPGKDLAQVIDSNIKADVQAYLAEEFGKRDLQDAKTQKNAAFLVAKGRLIEKYREYGITITSLGLQGGLTFYDKEIQESINKAYTAEMAIKQREQEKEAQKFENERLLSIAENQRKQAEEFAKAAEARKLQVQAEVELIRAEAFAKAVEKWDGTLPRFLTGGEQGFLMSVNPEAK